MPELTSRAALVAVGTTAAAVAAILLYRSRQKKAPALAVLKDRKGTAIRLRLAVPEDKAALVDHVADHSGTGSGIKDSGDAFLIQEFETNIANDGYTVIWAEDEETGRGLGMMTIAWSHGTADESYWQSLRVAQSARGRGVAQLLFKFSCQEVVRRQGRQATARWGVVSANEIMVGWSARLKLHGPLEFIRHSGTPRAAPPTLPPGYRIIRGGQAEWPPPDELLRLTEGFVVASSEYGTQNFLATGWGSFNATEHRLTCSGRVYKGELQPKPLGIVDPGGALVAFASLSKVRFGADCFLFKKYSDAKDAAAYRLLLEVLPHEAHTRECASVGGYNPALPWLLELFGGLEADWKRATTTTQKEFHWKPAEYVDM